MNTVKKLFIRPFKMLSAFWKELCIRGKVNWIHVRLKGDALVQPSRHTLRNLLKLKNRQVYKVHHLFH